VIIHADTTFGVCALPVLVPALSGPVDVVGASPWPSVYSPG